MIPDSLALIIAGLTGSVVGVVITVPIMGLIATAKAKRAEKHAWHCAGIYYRCKNLEQ
jgi:uncharacterized membrane protein